jgi:hypothetical protein
MFSYLRVVGTSNRSTKLQNHCAMCLRKLLIGRFFLPLFTSGGPTLTPADAEGRADRAAKLRALIEASPKLLLEQTDLVIKLPKGQELGMVSWLARDATTGVTWLIQRGDKADPVIAVDQRAASCARLVKDCTRFHTRSGSTQRAMSGRSTRGVRPSSRLVRRAKICLRSTWAAAGTGDQPFPRSDRYCFASHMFTLNRSNQKPWQPHNGRRLSHPGRPTRCRKFWKRGSERRGSKPGRSKTLGLNRSS